jgi:hypothetical protein
MVTLDVLNERMHQVARRSRYAKRRDGGAVHSVVRFCIPRFAAGPCQRYGMPLQNRHRRSCSIAGAGFERHLNMINI